METHVVVMVLASVFLLPLAAMFAHVGKFARGFFPLGASLILTALLLGSETREMGSLLALLPVSASLLVYIWWAKRQADAPAVVFWLIVAGHAWVMKTLFLQL